MRKSILALAAVMALGQNGFAGMQLGLASGTTTLIIDDNLAPDSSPAPGTIIYSNNNFNGWRVTFVAGDSHAPGLNPFGLRLGVLASCTSSTANCASDDLFAAVGDSGFTDSASSFTVDFGATNTGATASTSQYAYQNSIGFGPAVAPGAFASVGPFGPGASFGSAIGGGPQGPGTYTLVLLQHFAAGRNSYSTNGQITAIPEPASVALSLGMLVASFGALRRKMYNRA